MGKFSQDVANYLERHAQCNDGDTELLGLKLLPKLAQFYADRKIYTVLYCSSCGFEGEPEDETEHDVCPACKAEGGMTVHTRRQWLKKQKEWNDR